MIEYSPGRTSHGFNKSAVSPETFLETNVLETKLFGDKTFRDFRDSKNSENPLLDWRLSLIVLRRLLNFFGNLYITGNSVLESGHPLKTMRTLWKLSIDSLRTPRKKKKLLRALWELSAILGDLPASQSPFQTLGNSSVSLLDISKGLLKLLAGLCATRIVDVALQGTTSAGFSFSCWSVSFSAIVGHCARLLFVDPVRYHSI